MSHYSRPRHAAGPSHAYHVVVPGSPQLTQWYDANVDEITAGLSRWIDIPSVAAIDGSQAHVEQAAAYASRWMNAAGFRRATILDGVCAPAAYAEWMGGGESAPTVLVVGHADVQPAAPFDEWSSPPFESATVNGRIAGRGSADGKGPIFAAIEAARGLMASNQAPALNLKFLIQGEATIGSPNLDALLAAESNRLAADIIVVPVAGANIGSGPVVVAGTRGLLIVTVSIRTSTHDLYTGSYSGAVVNPVDVMAQITTDLRGPDGKVRIPGFYHRVRTLTARGRTVLDSLGFDERAWREAGGVQAVTGETGYTILERLVARPSADVISITSGDRSDSMKAVIPGEATVRLAFGLVPDQQPLEVLAAFRSWLEARIPDGVIANVDVHDATAPMISAIDRPAFKALVRATRTVWDSPPVLSRHGGTGAPSALLEHFPDHPILMVPVGDASTGVHAPNEHLDHAQLRTATVLFGELWHELARLRR